MEYLIGAALLGLIPALIASRKGHSFAAWWIGGAMLFIVALPMAILAKPRDPAAPTSKDTAMNVPPWAVAAVVGITCLVAVGVFQAEQQEHRDRVTLSAYLRLQDGASYSQAVAVLGRPGIETARNHMDPMPGAESGMDTVTYDWINPDGSNISLMFQNDRLIQRAQFGLQ